MATNRIDVLDQALLRPGRIDRKIEFPPPNEEARLDILKIHSRKMNLTRGINLRKIAEEMPGASGAEVKGSLGKNILFYFRISFDWIVIFSPFGFFLLADGKPTDATQELIASGVCNVANSFVQGLRSNGGIARGAILNASGVRTQLSNLYTSVIVIIALLYLTPCFYYIPKAALASIIIAAVIFMVQYRVIKPMWHSKSELKINKPHSHVCYHTCVFLLPQKPISFPAWVPFSPVWFCPCNWASSWASASMWSSSSTRQPGQSCASKRWR